jgi:hypothetical protein
VPLQSSAVVAVNVVLILFLPATIPSVNRSEICFDLFSFKMPPSHKNLQPERRASKRFAIERRIRYRGAGRVAIGISVVGRTVNMSSVGMLIASDRDLPVGSRVELEVEGPFEVDDKVYWKLIVTGSVVRSETGAVTLVALKISSHEFRTRRDRPVL